MPDDNVSGPPLPVAKGKPVSEALLNEKVRGKRDCIHGWSTPAKVSGGWGFRDNAIFSFIELVSKGRDHVLTEI